MVEYINSLNKIKHHLVDLERFVYIENLNGEYSVNKLAENLLLGFFNILFDANFKNANYVLSQNYPGIDIIDSDRRIALQITSENTSSKILDMVHIIREYEIYKDFDYFYIYILDRKKSYRNLQQKVNKISGSLFQFDVSNIFDAANVYTYLNKLGDRDKIEKIQIYLDEWFGKKEKIVFDYPEYLTDIPEGTVASFVGREEITNEIVELLERGDSVLISAVGGLGKTEVAKNIMKYFSNRKSAESGINYLAWVRYDNSDLRECIKSAFRLRGEADEAWNMFCNMAQQYRERILVVIDNIENVDKDEYLNKLSNLPCKLLVTGRCRSVASLKTVNLQPLSLKECRNIFYYYYHFKYNNEVLNDIIELTGRLTIMVEFLAKVAQLEEISLQDLYRRLVDMGFKLSQEDVSGDHEKLRDDRTIIEQMCILFSLCAINENDQKILTWISIIPSIPFTKKNAMDWFGIQKNSILKRLFNQGMLEVEYSENGSNYWMHSVIASAIREQKKDILYEETRPFIDRLSKELDFGSQWGQGYKKVYLIPFSWSVSDIFKDRWYSESDVDFLTRLFYVTFESGNYTLCKVLIDRILRIDLSNKTIHPAYLIRDYKNQGDLLLKEEKFQEALDSLYKAQEQLEILKLLQDTSENFNWSQEENFDENIEDYCKKEYSLIMHKLGVAYHLKGDFEAALTHYSKAYINDLQIENISDRELSTDHSSIATVLRDMGLFQEAYQEINEALNCDKNREMDTEVAMNYDIYASICAELASDGLSGYYEKADEAFNRVISFREKYLGRHHPDLGDGYHEYALFLYYNGELNKAKKYIDKALDISSYNYTEHSINYARNLNTAGIIMDAQGKSESAIEIYNQVILIYDLIQNAPEDDYASTYYNMAFTNLKLQKYIETLKCYNEAEDIWKKILPEQSIRFMEIHQGRGECLMMLERYTDAIVEYEKALNLISNQVWPKIEITSDIAECYYMLGDLKNARLHYKKLLKYFKEWGETEPGMQVRPLLNLCGIENEIGNKKKSEIYYRMAMSDAEESGDPELVEEVMKYIII